MVVCMYVCIYLLRDCFQELWDLFGSPYKKGHSILGSVLGPPHLCKPTYIHIMCNLNGAEMVVMLQKPRPLGGSQQSTQLRVLNSTP